MPNKTTFHHLTDIIDSKLILQQRAVWLYGPIDDRTSFQASKILRFLSSENRTKPITIFINTPGGNVIDGLAIYDLIVATNKKTPVNGFVDGICMSMGLIVLQAMKMRYCFPHSRFLMHELQTLQGGSISKLRDEMSETEQVQDMLDEILAKRTGQDITKLRKLMERRDYYMSAESALQYNFVDKIIKNALYV